MTQLTPHFSLAELIASNTADADGIDNTPTAEHLPHLKVLAAALEQVRALFGVPMHITSGYRNPELNAAVGGVSNSDHALGYAADFHVEGLSDIEAARKIAASHLKWDQLIYEGTASHPRCVHFSVNPRMRQQVLSQPGGPGTAVHGGIS